MQHLLSRLSFTMAFFAVAAASSSSTSLSVRRVAIIGGGAGGLICASKLRSSFAVVLFEESSKVGGCWKYTKPREKRSPMYSNLRTNLPKQIMAFSEDHPFHANLPSYLRHEDVQSYLEDFAMSEDLHSLIRYNCRVEMVEKMSEGRGWQIHSQKMCLSSQPSPQQLQPKQSDETEVEVFDAVVICNGHYSEPLIPPVEGSESFRGLQLHSIDYDNLPTSLQLYVNQRVLVVGSRSSGTDMAREISSIAKVVYVADRSLPPEQATIHGNIHHNPALVRFIDDLDFSQSLAPGVVQSSERGERSSGGGVESGVVLEGSSGGEVKSNEPGEVNSGGGIVEFANGEKVVVDIVLWCTGDKG